MKSNYFEYGKEYILNKISGVCESDAIRVLSRGVFSSVDDFIVLISEPAEKFLPEIARLADKTKTRRFGKIIKLYAPIYVSNKCRNSCVYCGFNSANSISRKTLSLEEIENEAKKIKESGFDNILIVSGSFPKEVDINYLEKAVGIIKKYFSYIAVEIYPMEEEEYGRLIAAGVDGLALYQETYDRDVYSQMHPSGRKRNYDYRIEALERGGKAGFRDLGFGVLLGLYDWRIDSVFMVMHSKYIMKKYWKSRINFSFPRIRPAASGFNPPYTVTDRNLAQLICAVRLCFPDAGLNLSTRENSELRNRLIRTGVTQMSAGSKTNPGGYSENADSEEQFRVSDDRTPDEIFDFIKQSGFDPVWKDWDNNLK
ncbi:MAG TPA: 2-iminoacetate synthase ThiH [bacterium]|nr:2-iminoacetate synthase ThiH [bacterium]